MWLRGRKYWRAITDSLGELGLPDPPACRRYGMCWRKWMWRLGKALSGWAGKGDEAVSVDGKYLRGSKRRGEEALQVIALAGQRLGQVWAQQPVEGGDEVTAAVKLLGEVPLAGRVVSLDAGLMEPRVVKGVLETGGFEPDSPFRLPLYSGWLASLWRTFGAHPLGPYHAIVRMLKSPANRPHPLDKLLKAWYNLGCFRE